MATERGALTRLLAKQEVTYGVNPGGADWVQYPFVPPLDFGGSQQLLRSPVIGISTGRDPAAPFYDAVTVDGSTGLPLDLNAIGFWLKMLFGAPVTTGGGADKTHTFKSGSATALPSFSAEVAFPSVATFGLMTGCKANTMSVRASPTGRPEVTLGILGRAAVRNGTSVDASPTPISPYEQFNSFQGTISRNSVALGYVTAAAFNFSNGMEPIRDIGSGNNIREALELDTDPSGSLTVRLSDTTLLTDSEGTAPIRLDLRFEISGTKSIEFTFPRAYLPLRKSVVPGRAGVEVTYDFLTESDPVLACAMQVVLKNQVASY
jgi:hypothetical protein